MKIKLTKKEKAIEKALIRGEYRPASKAHIEMVAESLARRKKDAILNLRINSQDLDMIKKKAKRLGVPYQTFISELLHRFAA